MDNPTPITPPKIGDTVQYRDWPFPAVGNDLTTITSLVGQFVDMEGKFLSWIVTTEHFGDLSLTPEMFDRRTTKNPTWRRL